MTASTTIAIISGTYSAIAFGIVAGLLLGIYIYLFALAK